jgi:heme/copper-type cytochrome/quinol oxidase subunit 2
MKKIVISILLVSLILLLASCENKIVGSTLTGAAVGPVEYGEAKQERVGAETVTVKEFTITASKGRYTPDTLQVNKGDTVRLILYASDGNHGFVLPAFGINEFLEENDYKSIEFVADKDGIYKFFSNVYVGPLTKKMSGTLIVVGEE